MKKEIDPALKRALEQLVRHFGPDAVKRALSEIRTGRPRKRTHDELRFAWLSVEFLKRRHPEWSVDRICAELSKKGGIRFARQVLDEAGKLSLEIDLEWGDPATLRRIYYDALKEYNGRREWIPDGIDVGPNEVVRKSWDEALDQALASQP